MPVLCDDGDTWPTGAHHAAPVIYAWTSATGNNGSAFAGITADTMFLDIGLGIAMLLGCYAIIIPLLEIAAKPKMPESAGTFPTHGPLFVGLMIGVIMAIGGVEYVSALCLGPVAERYKLLAGAMFRCREKPATRPSRSIDTIHYLPSALPLPAFAFNRIAAIVAPRPCEANDAGEGGDDDASMVRRTDAA
jgi:hypothetical protein